MLIIILLLLCLNAYSQCDVQGTHSPLPLTQHRSTSAVKTFKLYVNVINYRPNGNFTPITEQQVISRIQLLNQRMASGSNDARFNYVPTNIRFDLQCVTICNDCYYLENGFNKSYVGLSGKGAFYFYTSGLQDTTINGVRVQSKGIEATEGALNLYIRADAGGGIAGAWYYPNALAQYGKHWFGWAWWLDVISPGTVIEHELLHAMNIPHTFSGGCSPGDGIADTPPQAQATWTSTGDVFQCGNLIQNSNVMNYGNGMGITSGQLLQANAAIDMYLSQWLTTATVPICDDVPYTITDSGVIQAGSVAGLDVDVTDNSSRLVFSGQGLLVVQADSICELDLRFGWYDGRNWVNPVRNFSVNGVNYVNTAMERKVPVNAQEAVIRFNDADFNRVRYVGVTGVEGGEVSCDTIIYAADNLQGWGYSTWFPCTAKGYAVNGKQPRIWKVEFECGSGYLYAGSAGRADRVTDAKVEVWYNGVVQVFNWNQTQITGDCGELYLGEIQGVDSILVRSGNTRSHTVIDFIRVSQVAPAYVPERREVKRVDLETWLRESWGVWLK